MGKSFNKNVQALLAENNAMRLVKTVELVRREMAVDQPLFALAKQIQWQYLESYGEDKFVVMFGGLHVERAALKCVH